MEYILTADSLCKHYRHFRALNDFSIHVPKGSIYGIVGKNGAGKTTLLRLICGLQDPSSGSYELYGVRDTDSGINRCRRRMGAVIETPSIYMDMTAEANLKEQYRIIGLPDFDSIPELLKLVGLENAGKKKARHFSLGMRQRLGIAVALAGDPDFLVLDEPINGLDPQGIIEMRELILRLNRERQITVLISSHILDELSRLATHYGFIDEGHIFAGYSDIAIGSARLFGITLAENFQSPYMARSVKEFWRRWHISLSRWFSDYVYIPLGGSRCRRGRHLCDLLVTFLCSGLWHGASWTFVLWGLYHGLWLCAETFYLPRLDAWQARLPRPAARALTVARTLGTGAVVCFGWVLFRVNSLADFGYILQNLGRGLNPLRLPAYAAAAGMAPWALALAAGLAALLLWADWRAVYRRDPLQALNTARRPLRLTVYYLLSLAVLAAACARPFGAQADFIYFQF